MLLRNVTVALAAIGLILTGLVLYQVMQVPTKKPPIVEPAKNPYQDTVAAIGIIEATNENISIGVPVSALVSELYVRVWDQVKKGDPLFLLDDRELKAQLAVQKSNVAVAIAQMTRLKDQVERLKAVQDPRAVSIDEVRTRENDLAVAAAQLAYAKAQVKNTQELISRLTIRAPKDGVILQSNVRPGEFAAMGTTDSLMVLGDLDHLQVRADIDEENAPRVNKDSLAVAYPKNNTSYKIPLQFVRIEPFVIPKKSLTGFSGERVDTRVLQIIYKFEMPKDINLYVGQQVDVFINSGGTHPMSQTKQDKRAP